MIGALILGLVAGFIARLLVPGKQAIGFLWTIVLGLIGAAVGYFLFTKVFGIGDDDAFDLGGMVGAVFGSVIVLLVYLRMSDDHSGATPLSH